MIPRQFSSWWRIARKNSLAMFAPGRAKVPEGKASVSPASRWLPAKRNVGRAQLRRRTRSSCASSCRRRALFVRALFTVRLARLLAFLDLVQAAPQGVHEVDDVGLFLRRAWSDDL